MKLIEVDIKEFKKKLFPIYKAMFPPIERRYFYQIKSANKKGISKIFKICVENKIIGFLIVNKLEENQYIGLDYFAILPEYQSKGYGSKTIMNLKEMFPSYKSMFIEIEKLGCGKNEDENIARERRARFYNRLGFEKLNFELFLFDMEYSTYILPISDKNKDEEEIRKYMFRVYENIYGKRAVKKHCRVL